MRTLLDTNVFISYLLAAQPSSATYRTVEAGIFGKYTLLLTEELLTEIVSRVLTKPYLSQHITRPDLDTLLSVLSQVGEMLPKIVEDFPRATRDPKDDYLLAYALIGQADYLVTSDKDVLTLKTVDSVKIVTPAEFITVLGETH